MKVVSSIRVDLCGAVVPPVVEAMQGDYNTRVVEACVFANSKAFVPDADCLPVLLYGRTDGTGGSYDTLPDGTSAIAVNQNIVSVVLAPQVLTCAGQVNCAIAFMTQGGDRIATFPFVLAVTPDPSAQCTASGNYTNISFFLPQPEDPKVGQLLAVATVENGKVTQVVGAASTCDLEQPRWGRTVKEEEYELLIVEGDLRNGYVQPMSAEEFSELMAKVHRAELFESEGYDGPVDLSEIKHLDYDYVAGEEPVPCLVCSGSALGTLVLYGYRTITDQMVKIPSEYTEPAIKTVNGIEPDENGNVEIPIGGGSAESAVLYTEQDLPVDKQAQARQNIGAVAVEDIFAKEKSTNLLDMDNLLYSTIIATNGNVSTSESYANHVTTDFIPCQPGDVVRRQFSYKGVRYDNTEKTGYTNMSRVAAYDENMNLIAGSYKSTVITYEAPTGASYVRVSMPASSFTDSNYSGNAIIIQDNATVIPYEPYGTKLASTLKPEIVPQTETPAPLAFLPDEICVAVGRTIEIYNNQVCPTAEKYHFRWICNVGKALKRKFSITGTEGLVGNYDLALEIYDDAQEVVYFKTATLKVVSSTLSADVSICPIGDSLTNNKYWLNEVRTLSDNKVSFVGTRGTVDGRKHEGRSGFTSTSYLRGTEYTYESEGVHPFWDSANECFSWEHYKTTTGINPTAVQIFLGTNDLFGSGTAETFTANIKAMVDSIRANDSTIPIFVVLTILPGNQNGLGVQQSTDGFATYKGKYKYGLDCKYIEALQTLHDALKSYTGLYFIPLAECHDNEYNFGAVETQVNPRAAQKEYMPKEGVHPQQQGYEQMADVMYSTICAALA